MRFFSRRKSSFLIIDIGSSSIGVAYSEIKEGGKIKKLYQNRKQIEFSEVLSFKKFLKDTEKILKTILEEASKDRFEPSEIHCFLSSPWFVSQTREVDYQRQGNEFNVDSSLIDDIVKKEIESIESVEKKEYGKKIGEDPEILETKIVDIKVNGYSTSKVKSTKAKQVEVFLFASLFSRNIKETFEKIIESHYDSRIRFHTYPCMALSVVRDYAKVDNFVIVNVSGEVTDFSVIKDGSIAEIISLPAGQNFLWRQMSKRSKTTINEVKETLSLYESGDLSGVAKDKVKKNLEEITHSWVSSLESAIKKSLFEYNLPTKAFLLTETSTSGFFSNALSSKAFSGVSHSNKPFLVTRAEEIFLSKNDNKKEDISLLVETLFIEKINNVE